MTSKFPPKDGNPKEQKTRCGYIAVLGAPNAGKSTLINTIVGAKVSIVSPKVQTTRTRVLAIHMAGAEGQTQMLFLDTPGIFVVDTKAEKQGKLQGHMLDKAWDVAYEADIRLVLVDASNPKAVENTLPVLARLAEHKQTFYLALNKIDKIQRDKLLALTDRLKDAVGLEAIFMISGHTGDGVQDLVRVLAEKMPVSPWLYDPESLSDMPLRLLAAELTREQVFLQLSAELPYSCTVETESWEMRPDGSAFVEQVIVVERESQRAIVLGNQGRRIKAIGMKARPNITEAAGYPVHLKLFVKVEPDWIQRRSRLQAWGLG